MSVLVQQWMASEAYQWKHAKPVRLSYQPGFIGLLKDLWSLIIGEI